MQGRARNPRRAGRPARALAALILALAALAASATTASAATKTVCAAVCDSTTIQGGIDAAAPGDTVTVAADTYHEDVTVNKANLTLLGAGSGAGGSTISGPSGGGSSTVQVAAAGVVVDGFAITRDGNAVSTWNDPLNSAGLAVQGQGNTVEVRNSRFYGNRTAIDVNNANGNSIHNNVVEDNRTGLIFRNQTDNTSVYENDIRNNWTVGVLFIDASGGTNSPVQSAANSNFTNNDISGNWYGQIVDRQSGGSLPAPGTTNLKNFSGNWLGTTTPAATTANSSEPGYAAQIPVAYGGTATAPAGQPDIAGPASANFDYTPMLSSGTDTSAAPGFQGDFPGLTVTKDGAQTGTTGRIQEGVDRAPLGGTVDVAAGTYDEDVLVNKTLFLQGAGSGAGGSTIAGPIGGAGATIQATAGDVYVTDFAVTRAGNNTTDWNNPNLNSAGLAVQGLTSNVVVSRCRFYGNRTGIDANNSNGNDISNNVIEDNRTGLIFRNQTDNTSVYENDIRNNWTVGVLFLDASGGTNTPVQSAANSTFTNNDISGNWYGQIVDRQTGGSLPMAGLNKKDFSGNWYGTNAPVITNANSAEPGYAAQIPVQYGGTATAPGGQPDIAGTASSNFDVTPFLWTGTDTDGATGFQGDFSQLGVTSELAQTQSSGRIQEAIDRAPAGGTVHVQDGTYDEHVTINQPRLDLIGEGDGTVVDPSTNGPAISIAESGTTPDPLTVESLKTTGAPGGGNTGSGLAITTGASDVTLDQVTSTANSGHGLAVDTTGALTRLTLDGVDFSSNTGTGLRFPTSMAGLTGLTIDGGNFDGNGSGMEIYGPPSTAPVTDVSITDSTFSSNASKGIYAERLSDAVLDNVTVNASGTSGTFAAGIDLNLKKQTFAGIEIKNSSITNSGTGDATNGYGLTIKARDDGTNGPTTLTGVNVHHNTITGNQRGIRIGEPTKNNAGPSDIKINKNNISGNVSEGMTNVTTVASIDAVCNWWGDASGPSGSGPGTGDSVGPNIDFSRWLTSSDLDSNCAPKAVDDTGSTNEDTTLTVPAPGVLANDSDLESSSLTAVDATDPAHGSVTLDPDGSYTYAPDANYHGPDSFTYKANDGTDNSSPATVNITVNSVNDAPVADDDSASTNEDTPLTVAAPGVLDGDTDVDGDTVTAVPASASDPAHGSVTLNSDGSYSYTPDQDYYGSDSFTYKATDGTAQSNTATVSITVSPVNDTPVANDDSVSTNEDTALNGGAPGVLGNDTDVDGDPLSVVTSSVTTPAHGSLTVNANGSYTYTPNANYHGADSFTYKASDGTIDSNTATVNITVNSVNDAPVADDDDAGSTDEDTPLNVTAPGVLNGDTDVDGDTLTATNASNPPHGSVTLNSNGSFTYTPDQDYNGDDSFTYEASDGSATSNTATVSISINPVNDAPDANNDSGSVQTGQTLNGCSPDPPVSPPPCQQPAVLANDTDVDNDHDDLTASLVSNVSHGTLAFNDDGSYSYTPTAGYTGPDSFTYKANDGALDSSPATVNITVTAVNGSPTANDDVAATDEDAPLTISAPGVLDNDTDPENDSLTAAKASDPLHGSVTVGSDGSYTYTPNPNFNGIDSFTYTANDGTHESNTASVTITVNAVDDPPTAADDNKSVDEDATATNLNVRGNDSDVDGDAITVTSASDPDHGTTTLAGGDVSYAPDPNYCNTQSGGTPDTFTYTVNGGDTASVAVTVPCADDAPTAAADGATVGQRAPATSIDVLANDPDVDGGPKEVTGATQAANGTTTFTASGVTYKPDPLYCNSQSGGTPDTFTYTLNGGSQATVSVRVTCDTTGPSEDLPPAFASARLTNTTFAVDPKGSAETAVNARAKKGTTFVYRLSEDARVLFTIEQRAKGRSVGGKCVRPTRRNRSRRSCTRYVKIGSFAQTSDAGTNRKAFSGKIGRKTLKPARYRATLVATDAAGNTSAPKRLNMRVVKR